MTAPAFRIIGPGRAGSSFALALTEAGWHLDGQLTRHDDLAAAADAVDVVIVATPDAAIASVAQAIRPVPDTVVVHLSGARGLDVLAPHARRAAVHPLMTLPDARIGAAALRGSWFAIAGDEVAQHIVDALHGRAFTVADEHRTLYHATAVVAANHTVVLLAQAERLAQTIGVPVAAFFPLVRASVDHVEHLGAAAALTGPAARGDHETIERHLAALPASERPLYRALAEAARTLALTRPAAKGKA